MDLATLISKEILKELCLDQTTIRIYHQVGLGMGELCEQRVLRVQGTVKKKLSG